MPEDLDADKDEGKGKGLDKVAAKDEDLDDAQEHLGSQSLSATLTLLLVLK